MMLSVRQSWAFCRMESEEARQWEAPWKMNLYISVFSIFQLLLSNNSERVISHAVQDSNRLETNFKSIKNEPISALSP